MQANRSFRVMFTIAALWNWGAALLFMAMAIFNLPILNLFLKVIPENYLWYHLFFGVVFVFGIGYYWAGQDLATNRNIVKMGILAKLWVFVLIGYAWIAGAVTILAAGAGTVDLIFTILFINVLRQNETNKSVYPLNGAID